MDSTEVLNHQQIEDKIKRIAWQIYEEHHNESEVLLVGIANRGYVLAQRISEALATFAELDIKLIGLKLNKTQLLKGEMLLEPAQNDLKGKNIVVIDDVLNSGATLIYGVKYFLDFPVKQINTVVLVDRNHKNFPIKADYKGLSLSTSLKQHVDVQIEEPPFSVRIS